MNKEKKVMHFSDMDQHDFTKCGEGFAFTICEHGYCHQFTVTQDCDLDFKLRDQNGYSRIFTSYKELKEQIQIIYNNILYPQEGNDE